MPTDNSTPAILWALLGTFLFTFVFASGKLSGGEIHAIQILWYRYISGSIVVFLLASRSQFELRSYRSTQPGWHFIRAVCGASGGVLMIHAATLIPIVDATAISLTEGLFAVLLAAIMLGERVSVFHWLSALVCAAGALVVTFGMDNSALGLRANVGVISAIAGAVLVAIESILIKKLSSKEKALSVLLYVNVFGVLLLGVPTFYFYQTTTLTQTLGFAMLGPIAISAQYCWIKAFQLSDAAIVAPINYFWVVFAAGLGVFWFDEKLSLTTIVGTVLICCGGVGLAKTRKYFR